MGNYGDDLTNTNFIFQDNKKILQELNDLRRAINIADCSISCHAETCALNKYYKNNKKKGVKQIPLSKLTLIVIRIDNNGNLIDSKSFYYLER